MSIELVEIRKQNPIPRSKEKAMKSFSFQVKPAIKLKQSLDSLAEEHLNPKGFGLIEVGEIGMDITARNIDNSSASKLWLKATGLINFECNKPMINKMVNLNHILQNLIDLPDEDTVTIHHLDGFDELFFSYGTTPQKQFAVELLESDPSFKKFRNITFACEGIVLCDHLRVMIEEYQTPGKPKIVSVDMSKNEMNVFVGNKRWPYCYDNEKWNGIRGLAPQQKHHAWFQWPHCEFLKKASMCWRISK